MNGRVLTGKNLLLATGSRPPRQIPGFEFDGTIFSPPITLFLEELPARMLIIGGGAIGCEFAMCMNAFGVEVTVAEMMDQCFRGGPDTAAIVDRAFRKRKIDLRTGAAWQGINGARGSLLFL
jgi:dihydrolipoamide dehydrogenase